MLLTHGAGSDSSHPTLVALEEGVELPVRRFDMPYRLEGRRVPDPPSRAVSWVFEQVGEFASELGVDTRRLIVGGRSYGGRMCSLAVADGLAVAGLVLLSYPLHSPGRPDRSRCDHFDRIAVPTLFVSGDADPFATPQELSEAAGTLAGTAEVVIVPGEHDPKESTTSVVQAVRRWLEHL
ncbi:MAG: alpha/beta hydrolase [Acidimicrobiales bacterium]|nr:MAG: alpha/beta hydrolase [Acidimicrobiales bacterium]